MNIITQHAETQAMDDTQIEALAYIDRLGGREFTTKEVAEQMVDDWIAARRGGDPEFLRSFREIVPITNASAILQMFGAEDPYDDELPVQLPQGRMFLTFSRSGDYENDLSHVDIDFATDEQKLLHGERLQHIVDEARREIESFDAVFGPFLEEAQKSPGLTFGQYCKSEGIEIVEDAA